MVTRKLGRTNLEVGVIGLGGEWMTGLSTEEVSAIFDEAIANGVNYLDVFMPQPQTRTNIGLALAGRQEKMMIQGHLCTVFEDEQYERTRDLAKTKASFEDLLARLQMDSIDVGMIHYVDSQEDFDAVFSTDIIKYAQELKSNGTIRFLGLSSHNPQIALKAVETGLIDVLMFSINPAYDMEQPDAEIGELMEFKRMGGEEWSVEPSRQKLYATCEALDVGITVMKPLGAGSLLTAETSPFGKAMSVVQCCHYCLTRPAVSSVLVGCRSAKEMQIALQYNTATAEEKDYSHIFTTNARIKMTGRCMYCNHCQPCSAHIDVAAVTKFLDMAQMQPQVPESVRQHYHALAKTANDCTMCGQCEPNCPFGVAIRENMQKARTLFG